MKWLLPNDGQREGASKQLPELIRAAQFLTLLGASLKPTSELIHEATWVEKSPNLWLETQFLYLGRK